MKILYQNVVPYRAYEPYAAAQEKAAKEAGLGDAVTFAWLDPPAQKFPDGSRAEMERIDREMIQKLLSASGQFDYLVVGCALDSAVQALWQEHHLRAYGAGEVLYRLAALQGRNFAVVVPEESMIRQYEELLARYHARGTFVGFASLDLTNPEMVGEPRRVQSRLGECLRRLAACDRLDEVIVGCTLASANLAAHGITQLDGIRIPNLVTTPLLFCRALGQLDAN